MRIFADANFNFLGRRRPAYVASAVAVLLTIVTALFFQFKEHTWLNYGVDFTGGTIVQVRFDEPTSVAQLRAVVTPAVPGGAEVTRFGADNEFLVRVGASGEEEGSSAADGVVAALDGEFGAGTYQVVRTEVVGPKIGGELQEKAALAILFSFALTLVYLAFRFEWRYGVAAIIATFHDIFITMGFIALLRIEVSLPTVAAVLTIIGYSLNDTIVVFDRIRENVKKVGRKIDYFDLVNRSINEVLPRTVMTSGTTLGALLALYLLGGMIIRDFALILMVGVLIGTYSSIFIASPALVEIQRRWEKKEKKASKPKPARMKAGAGV